MAAIDDLRNLQDMLGNRIGLQDPALAALNGLSGSAAGAYGNAIANQNTAEGLSPQAMSALRTQATSGINSQYQSAAQALNSQLLRRGAVGQAQLPGSGGDISRAYQPLYSAMEAAKTKATTDMILADEAAKRASLTENRANALSAASSVFGNANSIYNSQNSAIGQTANIANEVAGLESPNILKLLGTSALTSAISGGIGGSGSKGGLLSGTGINDSGQYGILGDALGAIKGIFTGGGNGDLPVPNNGNVIGPTIPYDKPFGPNNPNSLGEVTSLGTDAIGSLLTKAVLPKVASETLPEAIPETTAGVNSGALSDVAKYGTTAAGAIATAAKAAGTTVEGAMGSLGNAAMGLLTNPVTAVIGGAILATTLWLKSQAHWEANTLVKDIQNPFGENLGKIVNGFNDAYNSGQLSREQAISIRNQTQDLITDFNNKVTEFAKGGKDETKVALQALKTMADNFGARADYPNLPSYSKILGGMDQQIASLAA